MSCMSQNFRLFHVSNLSVRNFRIFLLMYPGSRPTYPPGVRWGWRSMCRAFRPARLPPGPGSPPDGSGARKSPPADSRGNTPGWSRSGEPPHAVGRRGQRTRARCSAKMVLRGPIFGPAFYKDLSSVRRSTRTCLRPGVLQGPIFGPAFYKDLSSVRRSTRTYLRSGVPQGPIFGPAGGDATSMLQQVGMNEKHCNCSIYYWCDTIFWQWFRNSC